MKNVLIVCILIVDSLISASPTGNNDCVCGSELIKSRIKNGQKVKGHKYPWMAQIRSFNDRDSGEYFSCGGSLIDDRHIVTAAHCFELDNGNFIDAEDVEVNLGTNKFVDDDGDNGYIVSQLWIDPNYETDLLSNDFAILTLTQSIEFNHHIAPICLPNTDDGLNQLTIAGWGRKGSRKYDDTSDKLLEAMVEFVPRDECNQMLLNWLNMTEPDELKKPDFNVNDLIADTHLCAINRINGGDSCSGDSGGPLMYLGHDNRWYLTGIVSGSWAECGVDKHGASLYTRLTYYQEIIKTQAPSACWRDPVKQ